MEEEISRLGEVKVKSLSRVRLFAIPWTVAYQASPSMGFSRQECWSGLPLPSPEDFPDPGIEPWSPALEADTLTTEPPGKFKFTRLREGEARAEALRWAPTWFFKEPSNWRGVNKVRGQTGNKGPGCKGPCRHRVNFGFYSGENEKPLECLGTEAWQDQM